MVSDRVFGTTDDSSTVCIDPRYQDAVLLDGDCASSQFTDRLRAAGLSLAVASPAELLQSAARLGSRPGRTAVVARSPEALRAARDNGFGLVIEVGPTADWAAGADHLVADVAAVSVRQVAGRMSSLPDALSAFADVAAAMAGRRPAVFFDFDGTLSPIVDDPEAAGLPPGTAEALKALAALLPVGVLSGRDLVDVRDRVGIPGLWYAGSHGFEMVSPDGGYHRNETAAQSIPLLERSAVELGRLLGAVAGVVVEHKRYAVAVHYRNAAPAAAAVTTAVHDVGGRLGLKVTSGRMVVELRPNLNWDKGKTLDWIVGQLPDAPAVLPIFLGDDLTDEDGFDAVLEDGVGIVVRHSEDGDRATGARFSLADPDRVRQFIERLIEATPPVTPV